MFWRRTSSNENPSVPAVTPRLVASGNTANTRVQLAHALLTDGRYDAALDELEIALRENPELAEGQLVKGLALARKGRFQSAVGPLRMAVEFGEQPRLASFSLAAIYLKLDKPSQALALADSLVANDPTDVQAHALRGEALHRLGRRSEALASYQQAIQLDPKLAIARVRAAELLSELQDWSSAQAEYSVALELAPTDVRVLQGLAGALRQLGRGSEAVEVCRRGMHCAAPKPELYLTMAECCLDDRRLFEAIIALRVAMSLDPQSPAGHRLMGRVLAAQGRHAEAQMHVAAAERAEASEMPPTASVAVPANETTAGSTLR